MISNLNQTGNQNIRLIQSIKREFTQFLQSWQHNGYKKYIRLAEKTINYSKHSLLISFKDLFLYNNQLAQTVFRQFYRYQPVLNEALTQFMYEQEKFMAINQGRVEQQSKLEKYQASFDDGYTDQMHNSVRDLKCSMLGTLRSFKGTVTRVSQIRPELIFGVFICKICGHKTPKILQQFKYTQPKRCQKQNCSNVAFWELDIRQSKFADFQKLRVQQDSSKIPPGSMPRSIDVILRNQNTQKGQPGDQVHIVGFLSVVPQIASMLKPGQRTQLTSRNSNTRGGNHQEQEGISGLKGVRDLNYKLAFIANHIDVMNNQFKEDIFKEDDQNQEETQQEFNPNKVLAKMMQNLTENQKNQIEIIKQNIKIYDDVAESLFPGIYGHLEIKKALLLQLLGGIHKKTQNKISIRGDINILIVGDPSTAKSQFLKCVNKFVPRSVYTNGKTTSAAGLTASVVRDQNGNVSIQAGALLLADNGICCIDQFDKMQLTDQVAIHEAMQQQTISIAKAGVQATLNARTSVLAAANPIFGRYDKSLPLKKNINISPPIMSRFDLFFIICDESNDLADSYLSEFLVGMHTNKGYSRDLKYTLKQIRLYLSIAKKIKPRITIEAAQQLRQNYLKLRAKDKSNGNHQYQVTVRQLESMIRLSQAFAKLHLDFEVKKQYVRQAYSLLSCSILKLSKSEHELDVDFNHENLSFFGKNYQQAKEQLKQKKAKPVSISHELYTQIQKNILKVYKDKQELHKKDAIDDQVEISQEDLCQYLLELNFQSGQLNSINQSEQFKRIIHAVIKIMIKKEKVLMIKEDHVDYVKRILSIHPNFVSSI